MKKEWEIVDEFISNDIQCFIAEWESANRSDSPYTKIKDDGFYQYKGYCVIPAGYSQRGIVYEYEYGFLIAHLRNPNPIANYKKGTPHKYYVPGGITYRDWGYGDLKRYTKSDWVIGFDAGHYGDCDGDLSRMGHKKIWPTSNSNANCWRNK